MKILHYICQKGKTRIFNYDKQIFEHLYEFAAILHCHTDMVYLIVQIRPFVLWYVFCGNISAHYSHHAFECLHW